MRPHDALVYLVICVPDIKIVNELITLQLVGGRTMVILSPVGIFQSWIDNLDQRFLKGVTYYNILMEFIPRILDTKNILFNMP